MGENQNGAVCLRWSMFCISSPNSGDFFVSIRSLDSVAIDYSSWMKQALSLAARGRGWTGSNPLVGTIILNEAGFPVASGYHARLGAAHAERVALDLAGHAAKGGTLFVNLEPCCHTGRTPPCTDAIIAAGIRHVVIAHRDPDLRVAGNGIAQLRAAGVQVTEDVESVAAEAQNEHYLHFKQKGRPFVTLKLATSLDGFTADAQGDSRWITSAECRAHAHSLRSRHDAILIGARTARRDDPRLTVRHVRGANPQRFVLVGAEPVPDTLQVFVGLKPALRIGSEREHCDVCVAAGHDSYPKPSAVLDRLGADGYSSLLVEGGSRVAASFLAAGCVQRVVLYFGNQLLGSGVGALTGYSAELENAARLVDLVSENLPGGFVVTGRVES